MATLIYHDGGKESLSFFRDNVHLIGEVKSIAMVNKDEIVYPFRVIGEMGEIWLSGYEPHTQVMEELGYPDDAIQAILSNSKLKMGPPNRWKPKPVEKKSVPDSSMEILEFLEEYYSENGIMPTGPEIKAGCPGISNISMVYERLHLLQDMGYIEIIHRKPRGIRLL